MIKNILIRKEQHLPGYCQKTSLELMKATVLAESYTFYPLSSRPADSSDVF